MGKKRIIKIIAGLIAGMTAHSILLKYTNRPESVNHLKSEIDSYKGNLENYFTEYHWNNKDIIEIKKESSRYVLLELKKPHFKDVKFPVEKVSKLIDELIDETLREIFG